MNTGDHHSFTPTAEVKQQSQVTRDDTSEQQTEQHSQHLLTSVPTDLRVNETALNAIALSSVAKYWVLTNLLPGPMPQVSVYSLPGTLNNNTVKPIQDIIPSSPTSIQPSDQLLLQHKIPVSISSSQGVGNILIPADCMPFDQQQNQQDNDLVNVNQSHSQINISQSQNPLSNRGQNILQMEDNVVQVIDGSKDQIKKTEMMNNQQQCVQYDNQPNLVLEELQVLDSAVQMETSDNNNDCAPSDNLQILMNHREFQNSVISLSSCSTATQFDSQDIKGNFIMSDQSTKSTGRHMMDLRKIDGSIEKISKSIRDQDLVKSLSVEMVSNMYKVNGNDINKLLVYHDVFGKLKNEIEVQETEGNNIIAPSVTAGNINVQNTNIGVAKSIAKNQQPLTSSISADTPQAVIPAGTHVCDICGKMFPFRYQLIVHRHYHTEQKPFTCQVCGKAFTCASELTQHGKCHLNGSMYTCTVCFNVFANAASLERHMKRHSNDKPYSCNICGKFFASKNHLDKHIRCHTGETPYRCQYCAKTFTRKEHMVNHVRKHTGETPHRCEICKKSFTRKEHFMNHVMWHTGDTPHHCITCGKKFTRKEHLTNHMRSHTNDTPFRCEICGKSFTRKEHFMNHIVWHTGKTPHRCDFCSKTFTRKEHLLNHVRQHTGESPHRCTFCSKSFTRKEHLVNHIRQHTGETPFRCNYCPKAFTRKDHLVNHVRQHTGESLHKCTYCTKSFTRKEHLTNHEQLHTGELPHCCHICSKSFTRKEHLTNHVRIHTGESLHRCEFCQKTFTRKEHLTNHLRQHTGETSHCCNVCSKPFTCKEHLINHMLCHTGERPFECTQCGKSFPLKGNLLFHQRSHNKGSDAERPFRCDLCQKDFMYKGHLVSHQRSHSRERPHACTVCDKTFVEKGNLLRHLRKHTVNNATQITQFNGIIPEQRTYKIQNRHGNQPQAMPLSTSTGILVEQNQQLNHPILPAIVPPSGNRDQNITSINEY